MNIRYRVDLTQAERGELMSLLSGGKHGARKLKRAQILLAADAGAHDAEIERSVGAGGSTVYRTKRRFVEAGVAAALSKQPRTDAERKLTGNEEALLVATACSSPPAGRKRWTLDLLAKHASWLNMVEIEIGVLRTQCLDRRIDNREDMETEIAAWQHQRNASAARIKWMFSTEKARTKLARAYPKLDGKES